MQFWGGEFSTTVLQVEERGAFIGDGLRERDREKLYQTASVSNGTNGLKELLCNNEGTNF